MRKIGVMLAVGLAALAWGYGDLPNTFDASTGYVTMKTRDNTGAGNQAFYFGTHWSDGLPPHSDTNYYVKSGMCLGTPHQNSDVTAQQAIDSDGYLTFQGRSVVIAGYIWHLNGTYEFTIPDLHMLPGAYISYTANKPTLHGTMTVYGTKATPTRIQFGMDSMRTILLDLTIKGDANSCLATSWDRQPSWAKLAGDLSEFYGTLYVGYGTNRVNNSIGFWITTDRLGGTVELPMANASLYVDSASGLTVGGLKLTSDGTKLFLDGAQVNDTVPRLTVTNCLEVARPISVMLNHGTISGSSAPSFSAPVEPAEPGVRPLIRLTSEVVRNGGWTDSRLYDLFLLSTSPALKFSELLWRDDADGGKTLCLATGVMHTPVGDSANTRSSFVYATKTDGGTDYFWDHQSCPADDANSAGTCYFATNTVYLPKGNFYQFPGKMMVMTDASIGMHTTGLPGFRCDNLVWRGSGINLWGPTGQTPVRYDETGNRYYFCACQGRIRVLGGYSANSIRVYGGNNVARIEAEIVGAGDLTVLTINSAANYKNDRGCVEFTALNTNYLGKITMSTSNHTYNDSGVVVPNWEQRVRLFVSDERNLGGKRDGFAWDALLIKQYSDLFLLNDVTFTDGWNRGIAIGNIGRINVPSNLTLTVWRPLNVKGNLVKEGDGTLALGGTLTFGGSAQSATPTADANLLTVMGGCIKPLATNAFDGLAITFTNNAALCVDATPVDATLRQYGLVNTKEATAPVALAPNQATLPVQVDFGAATEPPAVQWTVGLVTLESAKAAALKEQMRLAVVSPFKSWCGKLDLVDNGNGTSTVFANYKQFGMTIIFR